MGNWKRKKIGFVIPWYGDKIPGGAEMELRGLVKHLLEAGVELEVLTTCVEKFQSDWNKNYHASGLTVEAGVPVRRFKVRKRDTRLFDSINGKLMRGEIVSPEEEEIFQREMVNSPDLYSYMKKNEADYSLFVFIPYMFGTTYYGCQICPEKSVLIPCLHDEPYAYMSNMKTAFRKVAGLIFYSEPERKLAQKLYGCQGTGFQNLGAGLDTGFTFDALRFRKKYDISQPFILYAGRKDVGKKVDVLIKYFTRYKNRYPSELKLVLLGGGTISYSSSDIIDLGFVPAQDKYDAYAAASIFCNPSQFESFSLVIMESWLTGRPVLVNGDCAVTRDFVSRTNGGLYYQSYPEFEKCVAYLLEHLEIADQMGKNGCKFVHENFAWDRIVEKYTRFFDGIAGAENQ